MRAAARSGSIHCVNSSGDSEKYDVVPLSGITEVINPRAVKLNRSDERTVARDPKGSAGGVALIRATSIARDGTVDISGAEQIQDDDRSGLNWLQDGDVLVPTVFNGGYRLRVGAYWGGAAVAVAGGQIAVIRPAGQMRSVEGTRWLVSYLGSEQVSGYLRASASTLGAANRDGHVLARMNLDALRGMPVPKPDERTMQALRDLHEAADRFKAWQSEALDAAAGMFSGGTLVEARQWVIASSQVVRQRAAAASALDDLGTRLRTRMPQPVAWRWRSVEAAEPGDAGYRQLLEAAETLLCFAAVTAYVMARAADVPLRYLEQLSQRAGMTRGLAVGLGDWTAILQEVETSKASRKLPVDTPFGEVRTMLASDKAKAARKALADRRNDGVHMKALRGARLLDAYEEARQELTVLMQASEPLADYPLRLIERVELDSLTGLSRVAYRDLMGDHSVVPPARLETTESLEVGSLYLCDRDGRHHLLRPVLLRAGCPTCDHQHVFVFDKFAGKSAEPTYRSMDDGHVIAQAGQAAALRAVGLLPSDD